MKIFDKIKYKKIVAAGSLVFFIVTLIPLLYASIYNHPTGDDIYYGLQAHLAWEETGSVWEAFLAAIKGVGEYYYKWQGTFSAMLIMHLQPTVFAEEAYFLTPFIVLGSLLTGSAYLWRQITRFILPVEKTEAVGIWSIVMFVAVQWVFSIGEAFYWFNGAVYYSGFYGMMLWMFGLICKYLYVGGKHRIILAYVLAVLIGGSNYITLLFSMIVLMLLSDFLIWKKNPKKWLVLGMFVVIGICLFISASAPGNSIRAATVASLPAYKAVLFSLWKGVGFTDLWLDAWWFIGALLLLPFFVSIIRRLPWKFSYPLLLVGFLYGMFCSMICPTMYAQSTAGPGRAVNLYRYGFVLLSYIAVFYVTGWCIRKLEQHVSDIERLIQSFKGFGILAIGCMIVLQLGISYNNGSIKDISVVKAVSDIISGTGEAYNAEYEARLEALRAEHNGDVVFTPFVNQPQTVYVGDLGQDASFGANQAMAQWYHKNSVIVDWGM